MLKNWLIRIKMLIFSFSWRKSEDLVPLAFSSMWQELLELYHSCPILLGPTVLPVCQTPPSPYCSATSGHFFFSWVGAALFLRGAGDFFGNLTLSLFSLSWSVSLYLSLFLIITQKQHKRCRRPGCYCLHTQPVSPINVSLLTPVGVSDPCSRGDTWVTGTLAFFISFEI